MSHSLYIMYIMTTFNPLTAKLFNLNFHPLKVVSRWRDPQLQVSENYSDLTKWRLTLFKSCWLMSHFICNIFKMWYLMCSYKMKNRIYAAPAVKGLNGRVTSRLGDPNIDHSVWHLGINWPVITARWSNAGLLMVRVANDGPTINQHWV